MDFSPAAGRLSLSGWTRNDYDANMTYGQARFRFGEDGSFSGSLDWSSGTSYNSAESSPVVGQWSVSGAPIGDVDRALWTQIDEAAQVTWQERYHKGASLFCYSGSFSLMEKPDGNGDLKMVMSLQGRYQMHDGADTPTPVVRPGPHGTGTFEFLLDMLRTEDSGGQRFEPIQSARLADGTEDCIICMTCPAVATFIHGDSSHRVCCDACAARLLQVQHSCPMCRRVVDRVEY